MCSSDLEVGLVTCVETNRHNLVDGNVVRINEVEGMTELNGREFKVVVKTPYSFAIGDTSALSSYKKGGFVEQIKTPVELEFKPVSEFFGREVPFDVCLVADKYDRATLYPFYVQGLLAFRESVGAWPTPGSQVHAQQVEALVEKVYQKAFPTATPFDAATKKWIQLLAKGSAGVISPMCAIFGGIIGQEIIKAVSSKYTPIKQFFFNDALECLPSEDLNEENCKPRGTRYDGQVS